MLCASMTLPTIALLPAPPVPAVKTGGLFVKEGLNGCTSLRIPLHTDAFCVGVLLCNEFRRGRIHTTKEEPFWFAGLLAHHLYEG